MGPANLPDPKNYNFPFFGFILLLYIEKTGAHDEIAG